MHLYINNDLKIKPYNEKLYSVYIHHNRVSFLDEDTLECLLMIGKGLELEDFKADLSLKFPLVRADKLINRLLNQEILTYNQPKYTWISNNFGASRISHEEAEAVMEVLHSKRLFRYGELTLDSLRHLRYSPCTRLEHEISKLTGTRYCLAVNSGTSALLCAFKALGIGEGDEVICPTFNYIGSATSMMHFGATPVLCNIDDTFMLYPEEAEQRITPNTKAILCSHLQGKAARVKELQIIAKKHNIFLIEDCAQSFGAFYEDQALGSFGDVACFSFHEHKVLSSGEGGALVTNNQEIYEKALLYSDASLLYMHPKYLPGFPAQNMRLSELHAAIFMEQMKKLDLFANHLRSLHRLMTQKLSLLHDIDLQTIENYAGYIPQSIYIGLKSQELAVQLAEFLRGIGVQAKPLYNEKEITTNVFMHWPCLLEKMGVHTSTEKQYSKTTDLLSRTVTLSFGLDITEDLVDKVSDEIVQFCSSLGME